MNKAHTVAGPILRPSECLEDDEFGSDKAFLCSKTGGLSYWILDSGCSAHMTSRKELLNSIKPHKGIVTLANGSEISVE